MGKYSGSGVSPNTKPQTAPRNKQYLSWLEVVLEGKTATDRLWLYSQPGTSAGFDNGWDGFKFFGTPHSFIFTETEAGPMQVDADVSIDSKLISFYANENRDYTLHLVRSKLQDYNNLHLLDLEARVAVPLNSDTISYSFTANSKGQVARRFMLSNSADPQFDLNGKQLLSVRRINNNRLTINNNTTSPARLALYDSSGRQLLLKNFSSAIYDLDLKLPAGVYILQVVAGNEQHHEKLILR